MSKTKGERRTELGTNSSQTEKFLKRGQEKLEQSAVGPGFGQGKPGNSGVKGQDRTGRSKSTFDLPLDRQQQIEIMSRQLAVTKSDIVDAAIAVLNDLLAKGKIDLEQYRIIIYNDKQPWRSRNGFDLPDEFSLTKQ